MLTSVLSKCLEKRLNGNETAFPHPSQAAYQRSVSCANMIFFTQEAQLKFAREGDDVYLYLYDLEKAFDCLTLLSLLFERGIRGKFWRPIKSWCTNPERALSLSLSLFRSVGVYGRDLFSSQCCSLLLCSYIYIPVVWAFHQWTHY